MGHVVTEVGEELAARHVRPLAIQGDRLEGLLNVLSRLDVSARSAPLHIGYRSRALRVRNQDN